MKRSCFLLLAFVLSSCKPSEPSPAANVPPRISSFIAQKEKHAEALVKKRGGSVPDDFLNYFRLAREGKIRAANRIYEQLREDNSQRANPAWHALLDVQLVLDAYTNKYSKYATAFGEGVVQSIPPGSIYFGGTDPGRGLPTAFSNSHADADPFFTLTQNVLSDGSYLSYIRDTYGGKIYTPTDDDSQQCFQDFLVDAQKRLDHDRRFPNEPRQVKPGEDVQIVNDRVNVTGQVSVMAINALLTRIIFDKNPEREFYVEESFPLDWMYPHLAPHGLIMKLHREPVASLTPEIVAKDREFWTKQQAALIGDWLRPETPVKEVCEFAEKVFLKKDLSRFHGDPVFVYSDYAKEMYSKLRGSVGGLYNWRIANAKSPDERQRMIQEADFAFRQSFAFCPLSPEAEFRYVNLLVQLQRIDDALLIARTAQRLSPKDPQLQNLITELERIRSTQPK